jgi:hypothetical protein
MIALVMAAGSSAAAPTEKIFIFAPGHRSRNRELRPVGTSDMHGLPQIA